MSGWEAFRTHTKGREHVLRFTGNGTGQPTLNAGPGITLNRTGVGIIDVSWTNHPGTFLAVKSFVFQASTASGVKGFTVVPGDYDATNLKITLNITNAGETLTDLSSTQKLTVVFEFTFGT